MALRLLSALLWTLLVVTVSSEDDDTPSTISEDAEDSLLVSKEMLRFMMGCSSDAYEKQQGMRVPVHVTEIDSETGAESQHLSIVNMNDLQESLKSTVYSDNVVRHIMTRIQEVLEDPKKPEEQPSFRHSECSVENNISISVPPQELNDFNERLMQILQQNSRLLLEQFNTFITYKLNRHYSDMEKLVSQRVAMLSDTLDEVLTKLDKVGAATMDGSNSGESPDVDLPGTTLRPYSETSSEEADTQRPIDFPLIGSPVRHPESSGIGNVRTPVIPNTSQSEKHPNRQPPPNVSELFALKIPHLVEIQEP